MTIEERTQNTIISLSTAQEHLTARQIAKKYMKNPTSSDCLSTGTICNILAAAGYIDKKHLHQGGKMFLVAYKWVGK